jgi:hypothetical protein
MDSRHDRDVNARNTAGSRRPPPGSRPGLRAFLPYLILAAVIGAAMLWIYVLGPQGGGDRGALLHQAGDEASPPAPSAPAPED